MAKAIDFEKKFRTTLEQYAEKYDIESLSSPNDVANLHTMIRNQMVIEELQKQLHVLAIEDAVSNATDIKKINDSIRDLSDTNMRYEKTLSIDRKSRKSESETSVADYIMRLKTMAREFLDSQDRLTKVMCRKCEIMVGRISGVYDTTEFEGVFQCPQCKKRVIIKRRERDVFFDVRDAEWRRKYPIEIVQPKRLNNAPTLTAEDELIIGDSDAFETEN